MAPAALGPRSLQPAPHRARIDPADLGARTHVGRRQRPGRIKLQQPRNQQRPGHPQPRRDLTPRARLPHPTPFRPRNPSPTTVPPRSPRKDQKRRSQDSGAERGVPPHDSRGHPTHRPTAVTPPLGRSPPAKTLRPDMPSLKPTHRHQTGTSQPGPTSKRTRSRSASTASACTSSPAKTSSPTASTAAWTPTRPRRTQALHHSLT